MAHKPSERTNRMKPLEGLNLVPMIDMVATLMFFLLIFAGILPVVIIDAPLPKVASTAEEIRRAKDTTNKLELNVWINAKGFVVRSAWSASQNFSVGSDGKLPYDSLHKHLVTLHQVRPKEREITLIPSDDTQYEVMIGVMDNARELLKGDPGYKEVPANIAQTPERSQFNQMFPEVNIGGV